jgi:hypothetical protein
MSAVKSSERRSQGRKRGGSSTRGYLKSLPRKTPGPFGRTLQAVAQDVRKGGIIMAMIAFSSLIVGYLTLQATLADKPVANAPHVQRHIETLRPSGCATQKSARTYRYAVCTSGYADPLPTAPNCDPQI